jgi:hypothetical protein
MVVRVYFCKERLCRMESFQFIDAYYMFCYNFQQPKHTLITLLAQNITAQCRLQCRTIQGQCSLANHYMTV